ncbi:hypothetical protein F2Q69_00019401 [Brassica cretica]|uniref:Uncharacterized protein n=1 Tax=Brassica cretica TaxID=69181 RepID=A0A8S9QCZ2_BRACR|nr:hypothetical protein F2Q69_00019401 [Brassica cretica]
MKSHPPRVQSTHDLRTRVKENSHRLPPVPERGVQRRNSTTSRDEPGKKPLKQSNTHQDLSR